ncbi:MAG TPA: sugar nucleotide-binding protein [Planctomycetota bacterium]|jgi:dTDP-4-dehydrorhamnose reductase|nr:sugar nucleotide-binding protein [Planctomycetota bacterium]
MPPDRTDSLLVTGASGLLGWNVVRAAQARKFAVAGSARGGRPDGLDGIGWSRADLSIPGEPARLLGELRPRAVLHCAARAEIGGCDRDPAGAWALNAGAPSEMGRICAEGEIRLVHVSTDLVFDGTAPPYRPDDPPRPLSTYGRSKALGERAALAAGGDALVVRVPLLYGRSRTGDRSASERVIAAARRGEEVVLFRDEWRTPLDVGDAAEGLLDLLEAPVRGTLHLGGPDRVSRLELGREVLRVAGLLEKTPVREASRLEHRGAPRPEDLSLDCAEALLRLRVPPRGVREGLARAHRTAD